MIPQVLNNGEYCKLALRFIIRIWSMTSTVRIDGTEEHWQASLETPELDEQKTAAVR